MAFSHPHRDRSRGIVYIHSLDLHKQSRGHRVGCDLAGGGIEPKDVVGKLSGRPHFAVLVHYDIIRTRPGRRRNIPLLKLLRLGVEHADLADVVFGKPEPILAVYIAPAGAGVWSGGWIEFPFAGFSIQFPNRSLL